MNDRPSIDAIFCAATEIETSAEREAYLNEACGDDAELRHRIERLLQSHFRGGSIIDSPAHVMRATIDQPPRERPGIQIGPYKLVEQIGEGGMGVVYMAVQQEPVRRKVALKIVKPGMDSREVIARFKAEEQALALMDRPHVAHVLDAGTTDAGRPYFVMELVDGVTLTQYSHVTTLLAAERMAMVHWYAMHYSQHANLQKELLEACRMSLGMEHPQTLEAMQGYALALKVAGDFSASIELGRETLQLFRKVQGDNDPRTLLTINSLAGALSRAGYEADALSLFEEAFTRWLERSGWKHGYTYGSMINFVRSLVRSGLSERAIEVLEEAVKNAPAERKLPPEYNFEMIAMLCHLHFDVGNAGRAEELLASALRCGPLLPDYPDCGGIEDLVEALNHADRRAEALALIESLVEKQTRELGKEHWDTVNTTSVLALAYAGVGKSEEAASLLGDVLELRKRVTGATHPETLETMLQLAAARITQSQFAVAEPLLVAAYEGFSQRDEASSTPFDHAQTLRALTELVRICEKSEQREKAAEWQQKLDSLNTEPKNSEGSE